MDWEVELGIVIGSKAQYVGVDVSIAREDVRLL
jgi:2-keto-4-pentenoate hydratase/2-oxohepta-3-ene-1,7-dioic acid hydratase in catechol pathway